MSKNTRKIHILFLEKNLADVKLELYELEKGGFDIQHSIAKNRKQFLSHLKNNEFDIIIADYLLKDITGIEAIHLCRKKNIQTPIMVVTGMGNEQLAVDCLREGAIDYILKKNITGFAARVERALDIWTDIKAVKTMKAEKTRLQKQLLQAQKMESVGLLAGGIAHDFNNLLTGIIGYTDLSLKMLGKDSPAANNLKKILTLSENASSLVKKLLLFSRKIPLEFAIVDINSLISNQAEFISRIVEETIAIELDLEEKLPSLQADATQLSQVLINFAVNARDAIDGNGTITIKTEGLKSQLISQQNRNNGVGEYIKLSFSDSGCGIPQENLKKIFDPFFSTKEVGKGTGLGLAVSYSIINGHNGWIEVKTKLRKGTTFEIYLPILKNRLTAIEVTPPSQPEPVEIQHSFPGIKTILIVEDDTILRLLTAEILESIGYQIIMAKDGKEALTVYTKSKKTIDLVVSDMIMPNKSGIELFAILKEFNPDVKFILVSGYNLEEIPDNLLKNMSALLKKPYTPKQLIDLTSQVLNG